MRKVRCTMIHRPFADTDRYAARYLTVDRTTIIDIVE